jgi:Flp pilus assembly secretin CpaC
MEKIKKEVTTKMETKELSQEIERLLAGANAAIKEAQSYLISQGEVVDLSDWVTVKEYCKRFDIKNQETVMNWINRGIVPAQNIRIIEEFNNTRLIKAVPYNVKPAKVA